jgi:hypothetical protein
LMPESGRADMNFLRIFWRGGAGTSPGAAKPSRYTILSD